MYTPKFKPDANVLNAFPAVVPTACRKFFCSLALSVNPLWTPDLAIL